MENIRESFFMSERWAATYNPANGELSITSNSHGLQVGDLIRIDDKYINQCYISSIVIICDLYTHSRET